jgi:hypothetical protein
MPYVQTRTGWIREHVEAVVLRARIVVLSFVKTV